MIRINDSNKYESIIARIENSTVKIGEIFRETTDNMASIDDTDIWTGLAQKEFSNQYRKLASNYGAIENGLKTYTRFMRQTVEDYKEFEGQTNRDVETNNTELDVNS